MSTQTTEEDEVHVSVENIGGIDSASVEFSPGITVLAGRNATNRTSFLRSMMAALGSDDVSLKGDAKRGSVDLTIGDESYTRTLKRTNGTVTTRGDPYLDDPEVADLFAFLLETNEARRAVERGDDLRELIMRPVDTEAIQAEIRRLQAEKRSLDEELDELEELSRDLPGLEERRTTLSTRIEEKQAEVDAKTEELDEADEGVRRSKENKSELESKLSELRSKRSTLEDVRYDLDTERESLEHVREEREDLEDELESVDESVDVDLQGIDDRIATIRDQKQSLDADINDLQSIIRFNEDMLEGTSPDVLEALRDEDESENDDADVTDQLLADEQTVTCWTCGTEVERGQIEETLDRLRSLRREKLDERSSIADELSELTDERDELEGRQDRRERIERRREQLSEQLERREGRIEDLEARREEVETAIDDLEATVEDLESEEYDEVIDLHREVSTLESERNRLEDERRSVESEIDEIEERLDDREQIEDQREEVQEALQDRRTQVEQTERQAVDHFNEHVETILELLDYGNLDRIWIERAGESTSGESAAFHLHVIRTTDAGDAYEDTIGHLSESEREVTGIIFALAGYLVHDVYEEVPFMVLDSLEAIDADRIARLVEYVGEHAEYLLVALLTEDAAALDDEYERITEI